MVYSSEWPKPVLGQKRYMLTLADFLRFLPQNFKSLVFGWHWIWVPTSLPSGAKLDQLSQRRPTSKYGGYASWDIDAGKPQSWLTASIMLKSWLKHLNIPLKPLNHHKIRTVSMVKSSMPQLLPWFQRLCSPDSMLWCQGAACRSRPFSICSRLSKRKNFKPQPEWSWKAEMLWLKFGMEVLVASSWHGIINSKSVVVVSKLFTHKSERYGAPFHLS